MTEPLPAMGRLVRTTARLSTTGWAFKTRYVRTPAGVRRYGVPIGSPIPVGRRVKPAAQQDGPKRRTVRTEEGARRYGVPIGSQIPLGRKVKTTRPPAAELEQPQEPQADAPGPEAPDTPQGPPAPADGPDVLPGETPEAARVRAAYDDIAQRGEWVGLVRLRAAMPDLPREQADEALELLASRPGVHVTAESNRKALTPEHRAAAVRFGNDDRHMMMVEADEEDDEEAVGDGSLPAAPATPTGEAQDDERSAYGDRLAEHYRNNVTLTDDELAALDNYTGAAGAQQATGADHSSVNRGLRGQDEIGAPALNVSSQLDTAAARYATPETMTTWRSLRQWDPGQLDPGDVLEDPAWQSTSFRDQGFGGNTFLEITVPKGSNGIVVNGARPGGLTEEEQEFILPRGTRYVIEGEEMRNGKRWIKVTALPPASQSPGGGQR